MTAHELAILAAADAGIEDADKHTRHRRAVERRSYRRHAERVKAKAREYYARNRERVRERQRIFRLNKSTPIGTTP